MQRYFSLFLFVLFCVATASAQSAVGVWKTVDDQTGEVRSKVEIYEKGGKLYGKIVALLQSPADTKCEACKGALKNKPVLGLEIIEGLAAYQNYWKGGTILDPESGSTYSCSIWFEEGKTNELQVRGKHWTGLFRTQTWFRAQ